MKDPVSQIMQVCLGLARADTHTAATEWMRAPISDLADWISAIESLEKKQKRRK